MGAPRATRLLATIALLGPSLPSPAAPPVAVPVSIDLAHLGTARRDHERVPVEWVGQAALPRLIQREGGTMEFVVRLPNHPRLTVEVYPPVDPPKFAVEVGITAEAFEPLALERQGDGTWQASLARWDDQAVRLRLVRRIPETLVWAIARITGTRRERPALWKPAPRRRPSVLVYVIDTLRPDRLGVYGHEAPTSPRLDRLAERGLVVEAAYATGPATPFSVPSLFASRYPSELLGRLRRRHAPVTLAEAFRQSGWRTAAFQANFGIIAANGFGRGFNHYRVLQRWEDGDRRPVLATRVHAAALEWLKARPNEPVFLYIQTMDPHAPYEPHAYFQRRLGPSREPSRDHSVSEWVDRAGRKTFERFLENLSPSLYDENVAYAAHEFARFMRALDRLGRLDDMLVVLTSDHGEPLGEHHEWAHGTALWEEQVRVPFIVWGPGVEAGRRDTVVSLIDLAPTVLEWAGLTIPESFRGHSLVRPAAGDVTVIGELPWAFLPGQGRQSWFARRGRWKVIVRGRKVSLYDLDADPHERTDVSARHPLETDALLQEITAAVPVSRTGRLPVVDLGAGLAPAQRRDLDDALRALGYVE